MAKCLPCMSANLKKWILRYTQDERTKQIITAVATCGKGEELNLCTKGTHARSPYQQFVSDCMKTKPIKGKAFGEAAGYMKECAGEWRERNAKR